MLLAVGGHVSRKQHWLPGHIQDCLEQVSMQHPQDRGCSMASPKWRERSAWKKKKKRKEKAWPPSATATRASGRLEMPQVRVSPFRNVPQIFPAIELLVSPLLLFLEDLLYCIQIHIWKRLPHAKSNFIVAFWLLSPTEEILHTQPTNLSSPDTC